MVYKGPSQGCKACRDRHQKCDRAIPSCQNCVKVQHECPGYIDYFDLMWRNQNDLIPEKSERERMERARRRHEKISKVVNPSLCKSIASADTVSRCLDFFWDNWVDAAVDSEAQVGFSELLRPLYTKLPADSPLHLATSALAVNVTYSASGRSLDSNLPSSLLSKALLATKSVINDPVHSLTDETLATILLLGACDVLIQSTKSVSPSGVHKGGALALVGARGNRNFESELARCLLVAMRHHTIRFSLMTGDKMSADPIMWCNVGSMLKNPARVLETYAVRLANLRANVTTIPPASCSILPPGPLHLILLRVSPRIFNLAHGKAPYTARSDIHRHSVEDDAEFDTDMVDTFPTNSSSNTFSDSHRDHESLIAEAIDLEASLAAWPSLVPSHWIPRLVSSPECIHVSIRQHAMYGNACDIYPLVNIAGLWNWYRTLRLSNIRVLMTCNHRYQDILSTRSPQLSPQALIRTVQTLTDDFCRSIPFHLGNRQAYHREDSQDVHYPVLQSISNAAKDEGIYTITPPIGEHKRNALLCGTWYLLDPLQEILAITAPVTNTGGFLSSYDETMNPCRPLVEVREGQREWLLTQLERIENINTSDRARKKVMFC